MIYALILFAHVGALGSGNSNALTTLDNFYTLEACQYAGAAAKKLAQSSVKSIEFVCVSKGEKK